MKKLFRIVLKTAGFLLLLVLAFVLFLKFSDMPTYAVEQIDHQVVSTPESVEKGGKLVMMLCANCHMNATTGKLSGQQMMDAPKEFGTIYSQNITQDPEHGIGNWTDGELIYLLRTGIKKDGTYAPPYMAKLPIMSDEDLDAIISFLRSDDPIVQADPTPDKPCEPSILTKFLSRVAFKPLPMPKSVILPPDTSDKVVYGKYLAQNLDCYSCHSKDFKTNNYLQPELSEGYFAGGNKLLNNEGKVMVTPNLTFDNETGIGTWSEEQFIKAVKYAQTPSGANLRYPMVPYVHMTDDQAASIYAYLKTIPKINNNVKRSPN